MNIRWVKVSQGKIAYKSLPIGVYRGGEWSIKINEIKIIGIINLMVGDVDSDFLIFIDGSLNKHIINLTYELDGFSSLEAFLFNAYNIKLEEAFYELNDSNKIIYPRSLKGHALYDSSWKSKLRGFFGLDHVANGKIRQEVIWQMSEYLQK